MHQLEASINPKLLAPIGRVAANFAMLEMEMAIAIRFLIFWEPAPTDNASYIVTSELNFKDKIALFSALYQFRFPGQGPKFVELRIFTKRLNEANEKRNSLLHASWAIDTEEDRSTRITFRARARKGLETIFEKIDVKQIQDAADFIGEVTYDVQQFEIGGGKSGIMCRE